MTNYLKAKVQQLENKNQFIITTNENGNITKIFQSYESVCCINQNGKLIFGKYWDYSNTTRKHLYIFLENYCDYYNYNLSDRAKIKDVLYYSKNKRKDFQKLIDEKVIDYDGGLY